ncbi:MAG: glycosyltransferase family 2 protein [Flavobacteriales bacterium]
MTSSLPYTVGIVIPCFNEAGYIEQCVRSCFDQTYTAATISVFVVDGMSTDGTRDKVLALKKEFPHLHLIDNPKRVTPLALNIGLRTSTDDVRIILGGHAFVDRDFVEANVRCLHEQPEAWCVGGVISNLYTNAKSAAIGNAMSSSFGVGNAHFRTGNKSGFVDTVAFGAYRKEVFDTIGFFNETLIRNQDDEFNFRIHKAGGKIYLDHRIKSNYYVRSGFQKLFNQYFQYGFWKIYVNVLHRQVTTVRQLIPFFFVTYLIGAALFSLAWPSLLALWLAPLALYLALGLALALKGSGAQFLSTWLSFGILHLSYGSGYLKGIVQLLLLRKMPSEHDAKGNR